MEKTYICLFDLRPYDQSVAPALRRYTREYDPKGVVALLREVQELLPQLKVETERPLPGPEDCEHWIDSIAPDAGYKPSEQTVRELSDMLVQPLCVPHGLGFDPMQEIGSFDPWFSERSEWFADLLAGGEELAGGRLEFSFGSGSLVATRQQIRNFLDELQHVGPPDGRWSGLADDYRNLQKLVASADSSEHFTLLKTTLK
ncbi:MAG: hypothetical protein ABUS49_12245 [Acidobacteriota bacterium]